MVAAPRRFPGAFGECFDDAAELLLAPVFRGDDIPDEERLDPEALTLTVRRRGTPARAFEGVTQIVDALVEETRAGDVVLVMSNGGFEGLHERLLRRLAERERCEGAG